MRSHEHVADITERIWTDMLGIPVLAALDSLGTCEVHSLLGVVHVLGDWNGSISCGLTLHAAATAASAMFCKSVESVTEAEVLDSVCEITNMTGGNLKSLLGAECILTIPKVHHRSAANEVAPETTIILSCEFVLCSDIIQICIHESIVQLNEEIRKLQGGADIQSPFA